MERTKDIKYLERLGIKIDPRPRNFITVNPVSNAGFNIRTPIAFTIGDDDLEKIVSFVQSLGLPGRRVVKALIKAVRKLTPTDHDEIRNNFWIIGYNPEDIVNYAKNVLMDTLRYHRVPVIPFMELDKKAVKNFIRCFGGIRGVQKLFTEVIEKTSDEFRRIEKAEAELNKNKIESEISSDQLGSVPLIRTVIKKQCFTCKYCFTDKWGYQVCIRKSRLIPNNMTVAEVNAAYPSAKVYHCHNLKSRYILHDVYTCEDYLTRVY